MRQEEVELEKVSPYIHKAGHHRHPHLRRPLCPFGSFSMYGRIQQHFEYTQYVFTWMGEYC